MWRHPWGAATEGPREGGDVDGSCVITYDRSKIKDVEAIVFHYTALDQETMPWQHYRLVNGWVGQFIIWNKFQRFAKTN